MDDEPSKFRIAISEMIIDGKLPQGDPRWATFNDSFLNVYRTPLQFCDDIYAGRAYTSWHEGRRKTENFICGQHIALDFDTQDKRSSIDKLSGHPLAQQYICIIHTTPSHTPAAPKARAVFLLEECIGTVNGYQAAIRAMHTQFTHADPAPKSAVSFFYGNGLATVDDIWISPSNKPLPLAILRTFLKRAPKPTPAPITPPGDGPRNWSQTVQTCIAKASTGNRNQMVYWLARTLIDEGAGEREQETYIRQFAAAMAADFSEAEALKTLQSARKAA